MALLTASSGVGRGEPSVTVPLGTYRPTAQRVISPSVGGAEFEGPVVR